MAPSSPRSSNEPTSAGARPWQRPTLVLIGVAVALYVVTLWIDIRLADPSWRQDLASPLERIFDLDEAQAQQALGGLGEMMAAVLGLALTVSSIIVQLAATRFTPHVTTLFFRARTNAVTWGFFVASTIFVIWTNATVGPDFVPRVGVFVALILLSASLALLFPYFGYVFHFLDPDSIIGRIMHDGRQASRPRPDRPDTILGRKVRLVAAIERLTDIALNALAQRDKHNASSAISALCELYSHHARYKSGLAGAWFQLTELDRRNADLSGLSRTAMAELEDRRIWVEWKVLRQYQLLFTESLDKMTDLTHLVAAHTRRIAVSAVEHRDYHSLDLAIKFFNTYLRAAINANNARTSYNVMHQYRQLAETLLENTEQSQALGSRVVRIAEFFGYYSELASRRELSFVVEVIAHDLAELCAQAHDHRLDVHDDLLQRFMGVDDPSDTRGRESLLAGVRRAQIKLATIYLTRGDEASARVIQRDMIYEDEACLAAIHRQLAALQSPDFWEINDRGTNFDYLSPEQKRMLDRFFGWFDPPATSPSAS